MAKTNTVTREMIEAAAAAIANARGGRRGAPEVKNVLQVLPQKLKDEVLEDAEAALRAILRLHEPLTLPAGADTFAMDLYSPFAIAGFGHALQSPGLILHLECIEPPFIDLTSYTREHTQRLGAAIEAAALLATVTPAQGEALKHTTPLGERHEAIARAICKTLHPDDDADRVIWNFDPPICLWHRYLRTAAAVDASLAQGEVARG